MKRPVNQITKELIFSYYYNKVSKCQQSKGKIPCYICAEFSTCKQLQVFNQSFENKSKQTEDCYMKECCINHKTKSCNKQCKLYI